MSPEEEADARLRQSRRLLAHGHPFLARQAAAIAHSLRPSRDARLTAAQFAPEVAPTPVRLQERVELAFRTVTLRAKFAYGVLRIWQVPEAYRARLTVALALVVVAAAMRVVRGGHAPLAWLFTGAVVERGGDDGEVSFTFVSSPGLGWILLSALARFMMQRPGAVGETRRREQHTQTESGVGIDGSASNGDVVLHEE